MCCWLVGFSSCSSLFSHGSALRVGLWDTTIFKAMHMLINPGILGQRNKLPCSTKPGVNDRAGNQRRSFSNSAWKLKVHGAVLVWDRHKPAQRSLWKLNWNFNSKVFSWTIEWMRCLRVFCYAHISKFYYLIIKEEMSNRSSVERWDWRHKIGSNYGKDSI